ncbi:transcriptional regulator family: Fungal Specific TF [Paecilomyces variotii]|nr:transcriptional regulator family: Fungal Specific TF [Paecilomyces variotii]
MRGVKKSRNGCARCKSKRLKCDEQKPDCGRCSRLGVKCPGYVQSLRWVTKHEVLENSQKPGTSAGSATAPEPTDSMNAPGDTPLTFNSAPTHQQTSPSQFEAGESIMDQASQLQEDPWDVNLSDPFATLSQEFEQPIPADPTLGYGTAGSSNQDTPRRLSTRSTGVNHQNETSAYGSFSPSSLVRNYPPEPSNAAPGSPYSDRFNFFLPLQRTLNDPSSTLIEYYFKEVAGLFSSYDSQMNPFRTTVSRLWGSSLAMCRTLQSMAAATLVGDFPQFGPIGLKMRREAIEILKNESVMDDKSLLALLMLGQTASWHNPNDLGISFFNLLRKHLNSLSSNNQNYRVAAGNNYQFFEEALIYWEMLLSYVTENDSLASSRGPASQTDDSIVLQRVPHPWTGIARDTQFTVQEVGRLIRRERSRVRSRRFTSHFDITQAQLAIERARELEEKLLNLAHPGEAEIVSPGDFDTPVWHLLTMAEVYRCTGLIQLYRVFPDLLRRRIPSSRDSPAADRQGTPFSQLDAVHMLDDLLLDEDSNPNNTSTELSDTVRDNWLTTFAITTLSRLKTIPLESRTRCLQPFLLVASCSELRLPPVSTTSSSEDAAVEISSHAIDVSRTRKFILSRLSCFLHVLPPKPIQVCLNLVQETWNRMDAGETGVYWMDVMIENGWETTMG